MFQRKVLEPETFETDLRDPSPGDPSLGGSSLDGPSLPSPPLEDARELPPPQAYRGRQHQLMVGSLVLLLVALGMLIYHDRDFWFPDTTEADDALPGPVTPGPVTPGAVMAAPAIISANTVGAKSGTSQNVSGAGRGTNKRSASGLQTKDSAADPPTTVPPVTTVRTVLPPLQVEVVAGNVHNTVPPGTKSVHVDLQPGDSQAQSLSAPADPETAAGVTSNAAENVRMSGTSETVSRSVTPNYPLLARQMQVQGSVILQAVINRDGSIQDLRIVSGPPILATAAREAVRQWHFKPRYQNGEAVETLARITVNFTISTN